MLIERVIRSLNKHRIPHVLVGGYAVALHGAVRGTVDIDLVVALNRKTFRQAENALQDIGLKPRLPVSADEVFNFREEYINNRNLTAWSFVNPDNPLEVVDIVITEDAKNIKSVNKSVKGLRIKVATIDELIKMKRKSGRKQDLEDVKALEKLR